MTQAFVGLGSNLGDPPAQIRRALERLGQQPGMILKAVSSLYRSAPLGPAGQPDYCNAVACVETTLASRETLDGLLSIEQSMGRERVSPRWGPRLIDLDLLLYGDAVIDEPGLQIPHPEMQRRNFVMTPLAELAPDVQLPGRGTAARIAAELGEAGLGPWETAHG